MRRFCIVKFFFLCYDIIRGVLMRKKLRNLFAIGTISALTSLGIDYVIRKTSSFVVDSALNRELPPLLKGNRNPNANVVPDEIKSEVRKLSEKLKNSIEKEVEIVAHDGIKLVGHWKHSSDSRRVIIAFHGWRSAWSKDFCGISKFFEDENCDVLYIEQRAHGDSGGEYIGFGLLERFDCVSWINYVNSVNEKNLPIYLTGISMGASTVLMASGSNLGKNVKGIIADSGFTSPKEILKYVTRTNFKIPLLFRQNLVDEFCKSKINFASDEYSTLTSMEKGSIPVLFIHGEKDTFVPIEMTYENYEVCKAEKMLFIVPEATHGLCYVYDKDGYEQKVKEFFSKYDV